MKSASHNMKTEPKTKQKPVPKSLTSICRKTKRIRNATVNLNKGCTSTANTTTTTTTTTLPPTTTTPRPETIAFVIQGQLTPIKPIHLPGVNKLTKTNKKFTVKNKSKNERSCHLELRPNSNRRINHQKSVVNSNKIVAKKISSSQKSSVATAGNRNIKSKSKNSETLKKKQTTKKVAAVKKQQIEKQSQKPTKKKQTTSRSTKKIVASKCSVRAMRIQQKNSRVLKPVKKSLSEDKSSLSKIDSLQSTPVKLERVDKTFDLAKIKDEKVNNDDAECKDDKVVASAVVIDDDDDDNDNDVNDETESTDNEIENIQVSNTKRKNKNRQCKNSIQQHKETKIQLKKQNQINKKTQIVEEKRKCWNANPKRHRVASLNAIAKVHCLYENESKAIFEKIAECGLIKKEPLIEKGILDGGRRKYFIRRRIEKTPSLDSDASDSNDEDVHVEDVEHDSEDTDDDDDDDDNNNDNDDANNDDDSDEQPVVVKRNLRNAPGLRAIGKHWDMHDSTDSSDNSDAEMPVVKLQHVAALKKKTKVKKENDNAKKKNPKKSESVQKTKCNKRTKTTEVVMDLKDMVVQKRMASLNATAILAASYSTDRKTTKSKKYYDSTTTSTDNSDSSAEEYFAAAAILPPKQEKNEQKFDSKTIIKEEIKMEEDRKVIEVHTTPNKKLAVILNQDTDVTITGVYSTTRSTHHEGFCSIAGMQYRISATSHTQTAATTVATETLLQSSQNTSQKGNNESEGPSCSKSYTPLDALSNMQPPQGPGLHNGPSTHHGIACNPHHLTSPQHVVTPTLPQQATNYARHHPTSGYHIPPPPSVDSQPCHSGSSGEYVHGYYQPAGPLISLSHGHNQPPSTQPTTFAKSIPLSDTSPSSVSSSVHPIPSQQQQQPPAPSSTNGDSSDNEVIITSVTAATKDPPSHPPIQATHQFPTPTYRHSQYPSQYPTYPYPSQYHYATPPPPTPPYAHHELCYPAGSYMRHPKYIAPPPSAAYHRYASYYPAHTTDIYPPPPPLPPNPQHNQQQVVTASPASSVGTYPPNATGPPPPNIMDTYTPAPPNLVESFQPPPHYYPPNYMFPTAPCYSPSRAISYINATYQPCPCPLNSCPKNGHTGPLTGESKRSTIQKPLSPVALTLPLEPASAVGPPSPARGSAGMPSGGMPPPPPSPVGANYHLPSVIQPTSSVSTAVAAAAAAAVVATPKQESISPDTAECKVEKKRKARVGKAMVRNNIQNTMLLMCNPKQNYVKREIESPTDKIDILKKEQTNRVITKSPTDKVILQIPEACQTTTTCSKPNDTGGVLEKEHKVEINFVNTEIKICEKEKVENIEKIEDTKLPEIIDKTEKARLVTTPVVISSPSPTPPQPSTPSVLASPTVVTVAEEPLPPCIATVAENVKVKNMKRKQSMSKEQVPEVPVEKKKKISSYKDYIKKPESCFKINNGKRKLVSKESSKNKLPKIKLKTPSKKKLNASKEQTNNRRIKIDNDQKVENQQAKETTTTNKRKCCKSLTGLVSAPKLLDNLIAKNIDKVIDEVVNVVKKTGNDVKKNGIKNTKQVVVKDVSKKVNATNKKKTTKQNKIDEILIDSSIGKISKKSEPRWSNGWVWEGKSYEARVFINSDETTLIRKCYPLMRHKGGDQIQPGDCVLLKAGPRKNDLPYVAKIAALWENPDDGEMMMSLLWYYRPEHTEQGRSPIDQPDEVFASRHKDSNSVACIEDKCYVLTFNEYCRYKKNYKKLEEGLEDERICIPLPEPYTRLRKQPPINNLLSDIVFFCCKVYDFRQRRLIKNPT